jgi:hypothetical protein
MSIDDDVKVKSERWISVLITRLICAGLIIITVLVIKYFFKDTYKDLKEWYEIYICDQTDVDEVLSGDKNEI